MPALKPSKRQECIAKFIGLFEEGLAKQHLTQEELAKRMGISKAKMCYLKKDPQRMNYYETGMMCDILLIERDRMNAAISNIPRR